MDLFREILAIGNGNLKIDRGDMYQRQREMRRKCLASSPYHCMKYLRVF